MRLNYRKEGIFKILQMTDTHIGNMPFHADDEKTFDLVRRAIHKLDVDLIIHTGDIIWSEGVKDADIVFKKFIEIFNESDIPIAITFGNHDTEEIITRSDLRQLFNQTVKNKAEKVDIAVFDDRENYVIPIYDASNTEVQNALFILDSGAASPLPLSEYDWNQPEQVEWFRKTAHAYLKGDHVKRHLVFQHIPLPEYWQAADNILAGVNKETNERISSPTINTGLFANMLLNTEIWGMFVGHDHDNNFDGLFNDIHLVYGNVSGYQTYGELTRGVRMIELNQHTQDIKTYTVTNDEL
ncbi:metallophosphoesterase family protein [Fundicoccus culcitae]|uniref:Metallophosphoesterase family protein n=1 Tax=Fundicoccus culcitae TaxID=2969821 RepID=A0ABY5P5C5_9LACT|nr:metallophosphoesterase family protein [Fundicoccus culcitae]UUX33749.1 metallophosphoesterase family protein [Fundicoccus culcitae]